LNGTQLARDEVGNAVGGIRAAEFEAPLARYGRYQGTEKPGCRADNLYPSVFLVRDDLTDQELVERYGSPENYLARYDSHVDRLVEKRRLLIEDALVLKARVRERVVKGF
jgi:hypothetical protein